MAQMGRGECIRFTLKTLCGFYDSQVAVVLFFFLYCRIFLSLMEAAGLTDVLRQEGSFTLFAPSDKAFASLATRDLELLKSKSSFFLSIFVF